MTNNATLAALEFAAGRIDMTEFDIRQGRRAAAELLGAGLLQVVRRGNRPTYGLTRKGREALAAADAG